MLETDSLDVKIQLSSGLLDLLVSKRHIDTTIHVSGQSYSCHRVILCAMSRYFDAMFSSGMLECQAGEVFLHNAQPHIFESVLQFMYGKNIELTADSISDILEMSSVYQIPSLQLRCELFLARDLSPVNCLTRWKLSHLYSCALLEDRAWNMIMYNFKELSNTDEFLSLSKEELIHIISDDHLQVENEETVCRVVLNWLDRDLTRTESLLDVFLHLKLPLLSQHFLQTLPQMRAYIRDNSQVCAMLERFSSRHSTVVARVECVSESEEEQQSSEMFRDRSEDVLVMVDGRRQEVVCFSLQRKKLFTLARFPYFADGKAACVQQGDIFVSGGSSSALEKRLVRFNTVRNRWDECCSMLEGRSYHSLVSVGNHLFSLSGFVGNDPICSIECYSPATNTCCKVGDMAVKLGGISAAALEDTIYMFGGKHSRHERDVSIFQSFNTTTKTACILNALPLPTCWSQAIVVDNIVRVFCPNGTVLGFDRSGPPAIITVSPKLDVNYFSVVYHRGMFLIIQVGDAKFYEEVRIFNPDTCEVHVTHDRLPRSLSDSKWMKVTISRQHLKYECSHPSHR